MKTYIKTESSNLSFFLITIVMGISTGVALVISGSEEKKWLIATVLGIIFFYSLFITNRNFGKIFFWFAVLAIPINLNFHLIFKPTPYWQVRSLSVTLFDIIFAALFFYWILQLLLKRQKFHFFSAISLPALTYILLAGISILQAEDKVLSLCVLFLIIKGYLVFLYFANNIKSKNELMLIISALALVFLLQGVVGSLQYFGGSTLGFRIIGETERSLIERTTSLGISRVGGTIGGPHALATFLNFFLPLLFCFLFTDVQFRYRIFIGVVLICGIVVELFTFSRGGWIGLSLGLLVSCYGIFKQRFGSRLKSLIVAVMIISLGIILALGLFGGARDRLFKDDYKTGYGRIEQMKVAFNIIRYNPFKGVGLNNYTTVMNRYDRTRTFKSYRFPYPVHNAYLIIAAESGLLALLSFLLILLGVFRKAMIFFEEKDRMLSLFGIGIFCGILTWIIHALFRMDYAGINGSLWFSIGLLVAINQLVTSQEKGSPHHNLNDKLI